MKFALHNRKFPSTVIVRRWDDSVPVIRFTKGYDGFVTEEELPICHIQTEDGEVYDIPYDPKTGLVSNVDLFQRFLDVWSGSGKPGKKRNIVIDIKKTASVNFETPAGGWTPEALIACGWWQRPNLSDIRGIDDIEGLYNFLDLSSGKSSNDSVGKKICVYASTPERKKEIEKVLMDNFTISELKSATRNGGIVIREADPGKGASGFYLGKQRGVHTPQIVLEPGADEDTITHEFTHHQRREDPYRGGVAKTPFPLDRKGYCDWQSVPTKEFESMQNLEEAATVAEATIRTRERCRSPTGYYQYTTHAEKGVKTQYDEDRDTTVGDSPQKGAKAVDVLQEGFRKTNISSLKFQQGGSNADVYLGLRELRGDLPKGKPRRSRKKKTEEPPTAAERPMASAKIRWKKG